MREWFLLSTYFAVWFCALVFFEKAALHVNDLPNVTYGVAIIKALLLSKFILVSQNVFPIDLDKMSINWVIALRTTLDTAMTLALSYLFAGIEGVLNHQNFIASVRGFCNGDFKHVLAFTILYWLILMPYVMNICMRKKFMKKLVEARA